MRILKKFWIISLIPCLFIFPASGQQFHNFNFRDICDSSKTGLCYWDLSWGVKGSVKPITLDKNHCLRISGDKETSVGFTEQSLAFDRSAGMAIIQLSSLIKAEDVAGKGAGLNIGLYDNDGLLIATKDMGGFYSLDWVSGSTKWKKYSIYVVAPLTTAKIKVGCILYGKGKAYFRDFVLHIQPVSAGIPNELSTKYISAVCDTISKHSLVKDSINIDTLKKNAVLIAGAAKDYSSCYTAVNYLLESLRPFGDEHSFFMNAKEVKNWEKGGSQISKIQFPSFKTIDHCGYIFVPPFHGGNQQQILAFADSLQKGIKALYDANVRGWIVDLRQNTGGNMAPMVAGLGPLFTNEKLGSLVDVNGKPNSWYYVGGKYYWDDDPGFAVTSPVNLSNKLPVAVLTSGQTGSSGEAVVLSFIGNEKTMRFGQPTWGLTTGNQSFVLMDGSQIFLASTIYADRDGNKFNGSISPDLTVVDKQGEGSDLVIDASTTWILAHK